MDSMDRLSVICTDQFQHLVWPNINIEQQERKALESVLAWGLSSIGQLSHGTKQQVFFFTFIRAKHCVHICQNKTISSKNISSQGFNHDHIFFIQVRIMVRDICKHVFNLTYCREQILRKKEKCCFHCDISLTSIITYGWQFGEKTFFSG